MNDVIAGLVATRNHAVARGDRNVARAAEADLAKLGYHEPRTVTPARRERAVPRKARRD